MTYFDSSSRTMFRFSLCVVFLVIFLVQQTNSACLSTQYFNTTTSSCQNCAPGCTGCMSLANCTGCDPGLTLTKYPGNNFLCNCSTAGQYYNQGSKLCGSCAFAITHCSSCTSTASGNKCTNCDPGYYINNNIECLACPFGCATCQSSTKCNTCIPNYALTSGLCYPIPCPKLMPFCVTCSYTPLTCLSCDPGYYPLGTTCLLCPTGCVTCNAQTCLTCAPGYAVLNPSCVPCQTALFNPGCASCSNTECFQCVSDTILEPITTYCECSNYGESYFNGACELCSQFYDPNCIRCNSTTCFDCSDGLFFNMTSKVCQPLANACGDGKWERFEECDDGDLLDGDGCNSLCKIEKDYQCIRSISFPTNPSFCEFTGNFSISLAYVEKEISQNVAKLYYIIEPSTFSEWTTADLEKFLSPVEIVDKVTGTITTIPFNSLTYKFMRSEGVNQLQLKVDYGESSLENSYIHFNLNKTATDLPSINSQTPQAKVYLKITSSGNGVDLYNYGSEIYDFQSTVKGICSAIGFISLIFLLLGLIIPFGKLIVIEALGVVQLTFFSVLQLKKVPPTFIGFRNLITSNGFNDNSIFNTENGLPGQDLFQLLGLGSNVLSNYNISFALFLILPLVIGSLGYWSFSARAKKSQAESKEIKDPLMESNTNLATPEDSDSVFVKNFRAAFFERILLELAFFGVMSSGYLVWTSILQGFKNASILNIVSSAVIAVIWTVIGIAFSKAKTGYIDIKEHRLTNKSSLEEMNSFFTQGFGDFKEIRNQISKTENLRSGRAQKIYLFFMAERVITSAIIIYLSSIFDFPGAGIMALFAVFLLAMAVSHNKAQKKKAEDQRQSIFCHIYQNYVLRQGVNFVTIIAVQALITCEQLSLKNTTSSEVFTVNGSTTKMIPMIILSLVMVNLIFNIFMWVWELKNSQAFNKSKEIAKIFFSKTAPSKSEQEKNKAKDLKAIKKDKESGENPNPNDDSSKEINPDKIENLENVSPVKTAKEEENEISQALSSYFESTLMGQPKSTSFMAFGETENRKKLVKIPKLRDGNSSRNYDAENGSEYSSVGRSVLHEVSG